MTHAFPHILPFHNICCFLLLVPRPRTKKQLEIEERIQQAVQAAYKRNGPVKPVEESHLMSERSSRLYLLVVQSVVVMFPRSASSQSKVLTPCPTSICFLYTLNHQQAWPEAIQLKYSNKSFNKTFKKTCFKGNNKQTSKPTNQQTSKPSGPSGCVLHQGEVKEEWTTAYEDMSCYYGYEGYGSGWDPPLGHPAGWDLLEEAFLWNRLIHTYD